MPPRLSRSRVSNASAKPIRSKPKKRTLDAYAAAARDIKEKRIPRNRLGEDIDDGPRNKRQRTGDIQDDHSDKDDEVHSSRYKGRSTRSIANAHDDVQYGSDSSGNEWAMGGLGDEDDDSELDSDEAFGDSDAERFEGFAFRGSLSNRSKSKKQRSNNAGLHKRKANLDEDTEDEDGVDDSGDDVGAGLGEDAVDLATMLDASDEALPGDKTYAREQPGSESISEGEDDSQIATSGTDEEGLDSDNDDSQEEDSFTGEERVARVMDRLENLDASRKPRQATAVQSSGHLTLEDLLAGIDGESRKRFEGDSRTKKSAKSSVVPAPLPKRQQDRLDREVATQKAREQLDRWRDTVIRNRRAEFLSFPMIDPEEQSRTLGKDKFIPVDQRGPKTELEQSIQRIMEESGLSRKPHAIESHDLGGEEAALLKSEELATNKLPIDEVAFRRGELRKARELLFREEIKAKRIAKIKSKSYRRVHRKEREKLAEQERQAMKGLGAEETMGTDEIEDSERRRAEARVATKHKDSKWAKALKATNRTVWDENARDSIIDQARRNEELRRRIAGKAISDHSSNGSSDSDDDEEEAAEGVLQRLRGSEQDRQDSEKGLSGLKFMRAAEERRRKENDEEIDRLRKELAIEGVGENESEDVDEQGLGRAIFGPQARRSDTVRTGRGKTLEFEAPIGSDGEEEPEVARRDSVGREKAASAYRPKGVLRDTGKAARSSAKTGQLNGNDRRADRIRDEITTSDWLSKQVKGSRKEQEQSRSEGQDLDLKVGVSTTSISNPETQQPIAVGTNAAPGELTAMNTSGWATVPHRDERVGDAELEGPSDPILSTREQRDALQVRAFAGDDVQLAFDQEKDDIAESEDEKEISNHLPGWGSWTGEGLSRFIRKSNQRTKHNPLYKSKVDGVRRADRKDANLQNVIISERHDRKGKKYLAPALPHGFETKAQYERSRRLPMGPEWSTKEVHQRMSRPRVVVKPGVRLDALERPLV